MSRHVSMSGEAELFDSESGDGEATPLRTPLRHPSMSASMTGYWGREAAIISHQESVYSLMVFAPPLSRLQVGHYWTGTVLVSFALLVIAVVCQLGLTLIAGQHIRATSASFKKGLLEGAESVSAMTPLDWVGSQAVAAAEDNVRSNLAWLEYVSPFVLEKNDSIKCCNGAECAAMRLACCDRSNVVIGSVTNNTAESMLLVMAKNTVEETKHSVHMGRSAGEMCTRSKKKGIIDCTAPSYSYMDSWSDLDSNGDGVWSIQEARADQANLGCRFGVSPAEMFRSVCNGIEKDAQDTSSNSYTMPLVPTGIERREAIPKDYFQWWKAMAVMCMATDVHRCSSLVRDGVFDGAIRMAKEAGITRGGVGDLDTALDFCQRMLTRNGICDKTLPGSYLMHRSVISQKCGSASYTPAGKHHNPYDERDAMTIMTVDYAMYSAYETSSSLEFQIFLFLILLVWYISLMSEFKNILAMADFTFNFRVNRHSPMLSPGMEAWVRDHMTGKFAAWLLPKEDREVDVALASALSVNWKPAAGTFGTAWNDLNEIMVIQSHSMAHRNICVAMCAIRLFLWFYLGNVGTSFMIYQSDYSELLMNAVALAFIFKLPETLYSLTPEAVKKRLDGATCAPFPTSLPREGWSRGLVSPMAWGLTILPLCTCIVVYYNLTINTKPFLEALQCACYQTGEHCSVAPRFEKAWWDEYWQGSADLAKRRSSWL